MSSPKRRRKARQPNEDSFCCEGSVTTPAMYRRYAQQCLQAMETVTEPGGKAVFFATAQMWNDLADQAERNEHRSNEIRTPSPSN